MYRRIIAPGLAAVAILLISMTQAGATQGSLTTVEGPFIGSYTGKLTANQAIDAGDARMAGKFFLVLRRNGTYTASNPLDGASRGRLAALPGKKLRFYKDTGCMFGNFERPRGGTYSWSLNGTRLTLRLVSEGPCWGRTQTLTYPVWKRR